jgi:hypothetical protein
MELHWHFWFALFVRVLKVPSLETKAGYECAVKQPSSKHAVNATRQPLKLLAKCHGGDDHVNQI